MKHSARNRKSLIAVAATALLVWLLTAGSVLAALVLILNPTSAPAGARVTGRTGGQSAFSSQVDPPVTYLVASAVADQVTSPDDTRLVELGRLVVDAGGNGQIAFLVPAVDPGPYVVMVECPSCAAYSAGRTMLPVADFRVTAPSTPTGPSDSPALLPTLAALGIALVAAVLGVVALRRRPAR